MYKSSEDIELQNCESDRGSIVQYVNAATTQSDIPNIT